MVPVPWQFAVASLERGIEPGRAAEDDLRKGVVELGRRTSRLCRLIERPAKLDPGSFIATVRPTVNGAGHFFSEPGVIRICDELIALVHRPVDHLMIEVDGERQATGDRRISVLEGDLLLKNVVDWQRRVEHAGDLVDEGPGGIDQTLRPNRRDTTLVRFVVTRAELQAKTVVRLDRHDSAGQTLPAGLAKAFQQILAKLLTTDGAGTPNMDNAC